MRENGVQERPLRRFVRTNSDHKSPIFRNLAAGRFHETHEGLERQLTVGAVRDQLDRAGEIDRANLELDIFVGAGCQGDPQGEFAPQALLTTQLDHTPAQMLEWFVRRWTMEVTFQEARTHLGIETQRQWNDLAIGRTTPALFALYSLVAQLAHGLLQANTRVVRTAAWYAKPRPTFSDALAVVRRQLWSHHHFPMSRAKSEVVEIPRSLLERLTDAVCYAA